MLGIAYIKKPPRQTEEVITFLRELVEKINMKILMGPYAINCQTKNNEGITGFVIIETSHIGFHCWSEVENPFFSFDVYSCVGFDENVVVKHIDDAFGIVDLKYEMIDRNDGIKILNRHLT